jgi:hypothetical protein
VNGIKGFWWVWRAADEGIPILFMAFLPHDVSLPFVCAAISRVQLSRGYKTDLYSAQQWIFAPSRPAVASLKLNMVYSEPRKLDDVVSMQTSLDGGLDANMQNQFGVTVGVRQSYWGLNPGGWRMLWFAVMCCALAPPGFTLHSSRGPTPAFSHIAAAAQGLSARQCGGRGASALSRGLGPSG